MAIVSFPDPSIFKTDLKQQIRTGVPLEAMIVEAVRIIPYEEAGDNKQPLTSIAIGVLLYDKEKTAYHSHAVAVSLSLQPRARIWKLLQAVTGKNLGPSNLEKNKTLDFDIIIGKHLSILFKRTAAGKITPLTFSYISPEKRHKFDISKYVRPQWVTDSLYQETSVEYTGSIQDALNEVVVDYDDLVEVTDDTTAVNNSTATDDVDEEVPEVGEMSHSITDDSSSVDIIDELGISDLFDSDIL